MPAKQIDDLMQIWASTLSADEDPPFADHGDLYDTIDATTIGDAPWHSFSITYTGERPEGEVPPWMDTEYDVWYRDPHVVLQNQLGNPDFKCEFDYAPYQRFNDKGQREWKDFMSANWAYKQVVSYYLLHSSIGAMT